MLNLFNSVKKAMENRPAGLYTSPAGDTPETAAEPLSKTLTGSAVNKESKPVNFNFAGRMSENRPVSKAEVTHSKPKSKPQEFTHMTQMGATKLPSVVKLSACRSTGVFDANGGEYVNSNDVELLNKLGFILDIDEYSALEKTGEVLDQYSYVEKIAGVPKAVVKAIDKGEAFSGEFLEDMDYSVPKGYEMKGDLCCPVEKEKTAAADPSQTILITGHSGAGKSTLAKALAEKLGLPLHRVDAHPEFKEYVTKDNEHWKESLTPGTKEYNHYTNLVNRANRDTLKASDPSAIIEGAQLGHLSPKELAKYKAHILVGGDIEQSIAQRMQRAVAKAAKKGVTLPPEEIELRKAKSKLVADYWHPGMEKFKKIPGVINYNHTEHELEPLIKRLQGLMKTSSQRPGLWDNIRAKKPEVRRLPNLETKHPDKKQWDKLSKTSAAPSYDTPYSKPTVENPFPGIIGDATLSAAEWGANKLRSGNVQAALGKGGVPVSVPSLLGKARMWGNIAKAIPAAGAGAQAAGAYDRYKNDDYLGSAIDGIGALGSAAQVVPHPVAKGVGLGVSIGSGAANAVRDVHRYNNRPVVFRHDPAMLSNPVKENPVQIPQQPPLAKAGAVAAWQRSEGKNPEGGLNAKGRASYKRETGGTLKAPVGESDPKGERAKRQNSFCSRMCGMKRVNTGSEGQRDPDSRINKSLRKWNCKCGEEHASLYEKVACVVKEAKGRCWEGYKPVKGKKPYSEDSCEPVEAKEKTAAKKPEWLIKAILKNDKPTLSSAGKAGARVQAANKHKNELRRLLDMGAEAVPRIVHPPSAYNVQPPLPGI